MNTTTWMTAMLALVLVVTSAGCRRAGTDATPTFHPDGTYRGVFIDGDSIQVNVEFTLRRGVVTAASFRHLRRDDEYHLETDQDPYRQVIQQYEETLQYLVGKYLDAHLDALYHPENIVRTEVDGYSAATLRSNKILSAIRDGLNRGPYSL